jgi:flavin reductase (DIM6/NTAB) family NADH-FMN oxidoreductase RutF
VDYLGPMSAERSVEMPAEPPVEPPVEPRVEPPVAPRAFKDALSRFASGVTVVTVEDAGEVLGITVSAFSSVSLDPPLVLVAINGRAPVHAALPRVGRFAVSVLAQGQDAVSNHYAGYRQPGVVPELARSDVGPPVVAGALAWLVCSLHAAVGAGDHTLFIGRVEHLSSNDGEPLVYFKGKYRALG